MISRHRFIDRSGLGLGVVAAMLLAVAFAATTMRAVSAPFAATCESLAGLTLKDAQMDSAAMVAAGAFSQPGRGGGGAAFRNLPAFCRVTATLTPSSDSSIKTEVWLPAAGWNGKFQAVGNGGWAGTIPYTAIAAALADGYAAAGTDTGHTGNNADFALGHPEKVIDLAYRSIHEMTVEARALIRALYGVEARFSYYVGCSQGGRQGLAAAQKYPEDFNGIVAGAAAWNQMRFHAARTALNLIVNKDADSVIPPAKYPMIHEAVINACDALDGLKDGVIENPESCAFDYSTLACKSTDGPDCLTKAQVASAIAMTSPLKDPATGRVLFETHLVPGAELGWGTLGGPQPLTFSVSAMRNLVFEDRDWDFHRMDIGRDIDRAEKSDNGAMYSGDPNLQPFFSHGGKLFMYHGWSDPQVNPLNSVLYYNNVLKAVGKDKAAESIALFMMPGVNHCQGGDGADTFDKVKVIEAWVEQGRKPERIIASHSRNGQVDKTRPLCPYGQIAKYQGSGPTTDAASFMCAAGR
ncbi:MAG TPA: tannase/feruloyl esterase family alpha/beta hydrolase [Terriglobia bacterium]|nr:tannase/feruloyl esterase family alpha/beta hydrolase [Terriglobia bacterium]